MRRTFRTLALATLTLTAALAAAPAARAIELLVIVTADGKVTLKTPSGVVDLTNPTTDPRLVWEYYHQTTKRCQNMVVLATRAADEKLQLARVYAGNTSTMLQTSAMYYRNGAAFQNVVCSLLVKLHYASDWDEVAEIVELIDIYQGLAQQYVGMGFQFSGLRTALDRQAFDEIARVTAQVELMALVASVHWIPTLPMP